MHTPSPRWHRIAAILTGLGLVGSLAVAGAAPAYAAGTYPTLASANIRSQATTASSVVKVVPKGTKLTINCYVKGQSVSGTTLWNHVTAPVSGYIHDSLLLTGSNNPVVPKCSSGSAPAPLTLAKKVDAFVAAHPAGSSIDYDGVFGAQCVDLVKSYLNALWGLRPGALGNAVDYQKGRTGGNYLAANGWVWHAKATDFREGDILVWSQTKLRDGSINRYGHVAIWYKGAKPLYDQNGAGGANKIGFSSFFNGNGAVYSGYWRHA